MQNNVNGYVVINVQIFFIYLNQELSVWELGLFVLFGLLLPLYIMD